MTPESHERLKKVSREVLFIPTTTRTAEQYGRIDFRIETPLYALVCNGGVLLKDGQEEPEWYEESLRLTEGCRAELFRAQKCMQLDVNRSFEVRNIRDLFVFTKSDQPELTADLLRSRLDLSLVDVFQNGVKVYVLPKMLNKGCAVRRMKEKLASERTGRRSLVIAAGDSEFDLSMADEADIFLAPSALKKLDFRKACERGRKILFSAESELFSDFVLRYVSEICRKK